MCLQYLLRSALVATALVGLVGVTVLAAGEQFIPLLVTREGGQRSLQIPRSDGIIAYMTRLNARDGGINAIKLVWEECETVFDVPRGVECYERLKAKGPRGAAALPMHSTPLVYALTERAARDKIPLITAGIGRPASSA